MISQNSRLNYLLPRSAKICCYFFCTLVAASFAQNLKATPTPVWVGGGDSTFPYYTAQDQDNDPIDLDP